MRDAHAAEGTVLMQPRWAMSFMRGPMTRGEIREALARRAGKPERAEDGSTSKETSDVAAQALG
jgi:hypothetical protein